MADHSAPCRRLHYPAAAPRPARGVFLHRVVPGAADRSYGVHVAELAGLSRDVTVRAWQILARLEAETNVPLPPARYAVHLPWPQR